MSKTKKIWISIISILLVIILAGFSFVYFVFLHHYKGRNIIYNWSATDTFDISTISTIKKDKDKDFVILNLADVQMCDLEDLGIMPTIHREIDYLVSTTHPDLITLTGDQTWSNENLISLSRLIGWLDRYKIPYAPVFGNHDYGNSKNSAVLSQNACCDKYEKGKYSLFRRGPSNLGALGNYVINIEEDGVIVKTLYMLDSGYEDMITDEQIAWMVWNADGIKSTLGYYPEGMAFMHKPIPEYAIAYSDPSTEFLTPIYHNYSLYGSMQNGFFDTAKSINVVDIVCGHQHGNNFTMKYEGVRLTFALKTGELGGYVYDNNTHQNLNGGTYFTIKSSETTIDNLYVNNTDFHIKEAKNFD